MTKKKYQRYSSEFKSLALRRASEDGVTDKEVCEGLGVSERQWRRWRDQSRLDGCPECTRECSGWSLPMFCVRISNTLHTTKLRLLYSA